MAGDSEQTKQTAKPKEGAKSGRATPKGQSSKGHSGRATPKQSSTSGRYTPPIPKEKKVSPPWYPFVILALLIGGACVIVLDYVLQFSNGTWFLLLGLALILVGVVLATRYR
jgi:hypothetical protein